jgi:chromosome segregation ATPase
VDASFYRALGASELLPRYAYLESLIDGARVLEVGAVASTAGRSASFLRERGARFVLAIDQNAELVERAQRSYASDPDLRFRTAAIGEVDEGPFDLVLVADASAFVAEPELLDAAVRVAGPDGKVVFGLRNPSGGSLAQLLSEEEGAPPPTYGRMMALLADRFASIEVLTQSSFFAYQLAPVGAPEDVELSVDGSLAEADEAAYFVAVCGARPSGLDVELGIVALPGAPLAAASSHKSELAERLSLAERSAKEARGGLDRVRAERADLALRAAELSDRIEAARREVDEERNRARIAEERADRAEAEAKNERARADALKDSLEERQREIAEARAKLEAAERATAKPPLDQAQAQARIAELEARLAALQSEKDRVAEEHAAGEQRIHELEANVAALEASERAAREEHEAEAERARMSAAEALTATSRAQEMSTKLEEAGARAGRLERDVATVSALERASRERAEKAEAALEAAHSTPAGGAPDVLQKLAEAEKRASQAEEAWESAEKELEAARAHIADLDEEAGVLEASLAEAEKQADANARALAELKAKSGEGAPAPQAATGTEKP